MWCYIWGQYGCVYVTLHGPRYPPVASLPPTPEYRPRSQSARQLAGWVQHMKPRQLDVEGAILKQTPLTPVPSRIECSCSEALALICTSAFKSLAAAEPVAMMKPRREHRMFGGVTSSVLDPRVYNRSRSQTTLWPDTNYHTDGQTNLLPRLKARLQIALRVHTSPTTE